MRLRREERRKKEPFLKKRRGCSWLSNLQGQRKIEAKERERERETVLSGYSVVVILCFNKI